MSPWNLMKTPTPWLDFFIRKQSLFFDHDDSFSSKLSEQQLVNFAGELLLCCAAYKGQSLLRRHRCLFSERERFVDNYIW